jgi:XTP/dITP diphosphohydrolase
MHNPASAQNVETWCLATRNEGKLREFRTLLKPFGIQVLGLRELALPGDPEETGCSFAENARLKAQFFAQATNLPVLGDDSGLEIFALGRRPGIHSARYAGPHATDADRIRKILIELQTAEGGRDARFVCALALVQQDRILAEAEGTCEGVILEHPRGGRGFGYDPVFSLPDLGKTFAELDEDEKNSRSHRGNAVRKLIAQMK